VTILAVEDLPQVIIKQNDLVIHNGGAKSVDDLKIFLEEQLYKYLKAQPVKITQPIFWQNLSNRLLAGF